MSHWQARLALIKKPSVAWYLLSCGSAMFGNGIGYIALVWLLLQQSNSISAMAILMACFWGPNIVLSPIFGVLADRCNRKSLMLISNSVRGIFMLVFAVLLTIHVSVWTIYTLGLLLGTGIALYIPVALAFIREFVAPKKLLYANSSVDIAYEVGNIAGMGMAGVIIALSSLQTAFVINGLCFLLSCVSLFFVKHQSQLETREHAGILRTVYDDFSASLAYLRQDQRLCMIYIIQLFLLVSYMTAPVLLAPFAKDVLHASVSEYGHIEAALSVGIVLGGLLAPYFADKFGWRRVLMIELVFLVMSFYIFRTINSLWLADSLYFVIGFCFSGWPIILTKAQEMTAIHFQGRVQSIFTSLAGVLVLFVYAGLFFVGDSLTIRSMYWFEVIMMLLAMLLVWRYGLLDKVSKN